jgi:hypothetical protein
MTNNFGVYLLRKAQVLWLQAQFNGIAVLKVPDFPGNIVTRCQRSHACAGHQTCEEKAQQAQLTAVNLVHDFAAQRSVLLLVVLVLRKLCLLGRLVKKRLKRFG